MYRELVPSHWPTDAQREQMERFSAASSQARKECAEKSGMARAACIAHRVSEILNEE